MPTNTAGKTVAQRIAEFSAPPRPGILAKLSGYAADALDHSPYRYVQQALQSPEAQDLVNHTPIPMIRRAAGTVADAVDPQEFWQHTPGPRIAQAVQNLDVVGSLQRTPAGAAVRWLQSPDGRAVLRRTPAGVALYGNPDDNGR